MTRSSKPVLSLAPETDDQDLLDAIAESPASGSLEGPSATSTTTSKHLSGTENIKHEFASHSFKEATPKINMGFRADIDQYRTIKLAAELAGFEDYATWARITLVQAANTQLALHNSKATCFRCGKVWTLLKESRPARCPACQAMTWDKPEISKKSRAVQRGIAKKTGKTKEPVVVVDLPDDPRPKTDWHAEWPKILELLKADVLDEAVLKRVAALRFPGLSARRFQWQYPTLEEQISWLEANAPHG